MGQKIKVLDTLAEEWSLVPSTYPQWVTSPEDLMPSSGLWGQLHAHAYIRIHINTNNKSLNDI